jgi:hypothetical protein
MVGFQALGQIQLSMCGGFPSEVAANTPPWTAQLGPPELLVAVVAVVTTPLAVVPLVTPLAAVLDEL